MTSTPEPEPDHAAPQATGTTLPSSFDVPRWTKSSQHAALRRSRIACAALASCALFLLAGLAYWQIAASRQVTATEASAAAASDTVTTRTQQLTDLQSRVLEDQTGIELNSELNPGYADSLKGDETTVNAQITTAQTELSKAEDAAAQADQVHTDAVTHLNDMPGVWIIGGTVVGVWLALVAMIYQLLRREKIRNYEESCLVATVASQASEPDPFELKALWKDNRAQLATYHQLVLNYASASRQTTVIALAVGFIFLILIASSTIFVQSIPAAVAASVVGASGTALTGFIANAVLRNADTSSREVLTFFSHPLDVERVLTAERIIDKMHPQAHDKARLLVIHSLAAQRGLAKADSPSTDLPNQTEPAVPNPRVE